MVPSCLAVGDAILFALMVPFLHIVVHPVILVDVRRPTVRHFHAYEAESVEILPDILGGLGNQTLVVCAPATDAAVRVRLPIKLFEAREETGNAVLKRHLLQRPSCGHYKGLLVAVDGLLLAIACGGHEQAVDGLPELAVEDDAETALGGVDLLWNQVRAMLAVSAGVIDLRMQRG